MKLLLGPGRQRVAFAVRDDVAQVSASLIQELDVDKQGNATPVPRTAPSPGGR